jgi:hypothetical protein
LILEHGSPKVVLAGNGSHFTAEVDKGVPEGEPLALARTYEQGNPLLVRIDLVTRQVAVVVPATLRPRLLMAYHEHITSAHCGAKRMYARMKRKYYWKRMKTDIGRWTRACRKCQFSKKCRDSRSGLVQVWGAEGPFAVVQMDLVEVRHRSRQGNMYVLTIMDRYTHWPIYVPIPDQTATTVARALIDNLILEHGSPKVVLADGSHFTAEVTRCMMQRLGTQTRFSSSRASETNGQLERHHRFLEEALRTLVAEHQDDWEDYLKPICFAYRTTPMPGTGYSPFQLIFGRTAMQPIDWENQVITGAQAGSLPDFMDIRGKVYRQTKELLDTQVDMEQEKNRRRSDVGRKGTNYVYKQKVLVYFPAYRQGSATKLRPKWREGEIVRRKGPNSYDVRIGAKIFRISVRRLIPFFQDVEVEEMRQGALPREKADYTPAQMQES